MTTYKNASGVEISYSEFIKLSPAEQTKFRRIDSHESQRDNGDFATSAIIGASTGSALMGGILGGDFLGGITGDLLTGGGLFD